MSARHGITITIIVVALISLFSAAWWSRAQDPERGDRTLVRLVRYECAEGRAISVAFYTHGEAPTPAPGERPSPTGSVDVALNGGATTTLQQTISADGTRYATADESFVFWAKGSEALVMRNNAMDLAYRECTASQH